MKRFIMMCAVLLSAAVCGAQQLNTSGMNTSGQSGPSEEARYVLGLVRNGRVDLLNKYFDVAPWKIQTEIDVYQNSSKNATVGVFCVAVDLGNLEVVKAFVDHGIGPADLCRVQTFSTKTVIVSKADRIIHDTQSSSSYTGGSGSSSRQGGRGLVRSWFRERSSYQEGDSSSYSSSHDEEYHQVSYGEKKVVKAYFANPLDFATDEIFDYLWAQGFRSANLFTTAALADAKATGKREVYDYILTNKPEVLGTKPAYISQETYDQLLQAARENPDSLATELMMRRVLGKINTSAQAKQAQKEIKDLLAEKLEQGITSPSDTLGYSSVQQDLSAKQSLLAKKEAEAARKEAEKRAAITQAYQAYYKKAAYWKEHDSMGKPVLWNPEDPDHLLVREDDGTYSKVYLDNWKIGFHYKKVDVSGYQEVR